MKTIDIGRGVRISTPILSADEAAAYMGVSMRTFRRLQVPRHIVSGVPRYDAREIDDWVKSRGGSMPEDHPR